MGRYGLYREENEKNRLHQTLAWLIDVIAVVTLAMFLVIQFGNTASVSGRSMEPVLAAGDRLMISAVSPRILPLKRFDIIEFSSESGVERSSIKRIIGLPGETVQIIDGIIYIDGEVLSDVPFLYAVASPGLAEDPVKLLSDEYFVLGDNSTSSEDSRFSNVGNVRRDQIIGRAWFCFAPLEHFGFVK